ncbi:MAG TPA: hypothetical protein PKV03_04980 [Methylotenera sp.]|nr:hypothetical protein [Methylotenera sp.]HPN00767.1 hypothetical protein [Methylotenera sp.]
MASISFNGDLLNTLGSRKKSKINLALQYTQIKSGRYLPTFFATTLAQMDA